MMYITKEIVKVWRRIGQEFFIEFPILCVKWPYIVFGLFLQYLHGVAARTAHFLHHPGPVLHDMGFDLFPELGPKRAYMSETVFLFILVPFVLWSFHPFVMNNKRFYTCLLYVKVFAVLVICQTCRVISFTSTQLPGPNYHCRVGSPAAVLPPPKSFQDVFFLNLSRGVLFGCGDLIFSSHMTFTLTMVLTYNRFGTTRILKNIGFLLAFIQSCLIIASRKHYSVDVVIAWYVVPLVFFFVDHKLKIDAVYGDLPDRATDRSLTLPTTAPKPPHSKDEPAGWSQPPKDYERRKYIQPSNGKPSSEEVEPLAREEEGHTSDRS